ncbi:hypothetical protein [Kitasatospora sp. NPDC093102]|uniref:hypothetical protein n=1 Tax=Kitasatospora sp. NPDC093102 TaxID=3155069 RepID=UPI003447D138
MPALHELAARGRLPDHQLMDRVTLHWVARNRPDTASGPAALTPQSAVLVPSEDWFADPALTDTLHGVRHNARVALLATVLAAEYQLDADQSRALTVAAAVHDCRRHNDRADPGHGRRAATWLDQHHHQVTATLGIPDLPEHLLRQAATAIALHDVPYGTDTRHDHAYRHARQLTDLLKAADALDRYRLPATRWWPDPAHLRVPLTTALHSLAFDLMLRSEHARLDGATHHEALHHATRTLTHPDREPR